MLKKELIAELFVKFEQAAYEFKGVECWSARELQEIFAYTDWRNFIKVLEKSKAACENAGEVVSDHFVEVNKMIELAKGAQREIEDMALELPPAEDLKKISRRIDNDGKLKKKGKK